MYKKFAIKIKCMQCIIFLWQEAQRCVCLLLLKTNNKMCAACVLLAALVKQLLSGSADLGVHWGSICPAVSVVSVVDCLSSCRWDLKSSTTDLSAVWQTSQDEERFKHQKKGTAKREIAGRKIRARKMEKAEEKYLRARWSVGVTCHIWWPTPSS